MDWKSAAILRLCFILILWTLVVDSALSQDFPEIKISGIHEALQRDECRHNKYLAVDDDADVNASGGLANFKIEYVLVTFEKVTGAFRGRERQNYRISQSIWADAENIEGIYQAEAKKKVPAPTDDQYRLTDFHMWSASDGTLNGRFHLEYQMRAATKIWCTKFVHIYPEFYECPGPIIDVPGMHAAGVIHSVGRLETQGSGVKLTLTSTYEEQERPDRLIQNLIGLTTFSIGGKYIDDTYTHLISDFYAELRPPYIAFLKLPVIRHKTLDVHFTPGKPLFAGKAGAIETHLDSVLQGDRQRSDAAEIYSRVMQAKRFFESCASPTTEYVVQPQDTLWSIARLLYGDGQYYHVIAEANGMSENYDTVLPVGKNLSVPPFYQLAADDKLMVEAGDTKWTIAEKLLGAGYLYPKLEWAKTQAQDNYHLPTLTSVKVSRRP